LRAVAIPHDGDDYRVVFVPEAALARMGIVISSERDTWAIINRSPSISLTSIQPVLVKPWNRWCAGVSPMLIPSLQGDYDGDEIHLIFVTPACAAEAIAQVRVDASIPPEVVAFSKRASEGWPCLATELARIVKLPVAQAGPAARALAARLGLNARGCMQAEAMVTGEAMATAFDEIDIDEIRLPRARFTGSRDPMKVRAEMTQQVTVQGFIGADTRLMRLALQPLWVVDGGFVTWNGAVIGRIGGRYNLGSPGLRLAICVGWIYQQAHLD